MPFVTEAESPASTEVRMPVDGVFLPAIATMSLGKPGLHPLDKKLEAAAAQGFKGVELFWDDLEAHAQSLDAVTPSREPFADTPLPGIAVASRQIRRLCDALSLIHI